MLPVEQWVLLKLFVLSEKNKEAAFKKMCNSEIFQRWVRIEASKYTGLMEEAKKEVEEQMKEDNLRVEIMVNGKWVLKPNQ
jgi:hypothetical protein